MKFSSAFEEVKTKFSEIVLNRINGSKPLKQIKSNKNVNQLIPNPKKEPLKNTKTDYHIDVFSRYSKYIAIFIFVFLSSMITTYSILNYNNIIVLFFNLITLIILALILSVSVHYLLLFKKPKIENGLKGDLVNYFYYKYIFFYGSINIATIVEEYFDLPKTVIKIENQHINRIFIFIMRMSTIFIPVLLTIAITETTSQNTTNYKPITLAGLLIFELFAIIIIFIFGISIVKLVFSLSVETMITNYIIELNDKTIEEEEKNRVINYLNETRRNKQEQFEKYSYLRMVLFRIIIHPIPSFIILWFFVIIWESMLL